MRSVVLRGIRRQRQRSGFAGKEDIAGTPHGFQEGLVEALINFAP
ncbi:unnamed protein product [Pararhodospirillum photometricum DSM 122]|uniref:Uncharacterized protein n=1 Tax=Pararhodospirillum photometricum DSM 122 TaxID=1150469 RepID=H6SKN2_PARPM|nr:unnamed protein product [Pararhodospirillum photometricum DSM 122]